MQVREAAIILSKNDQIQIYTIDIHHFMSGWSRPKQLAEKHEK